MNLNKRKRGILCFLALALPGCGDSGPVLTRTHYVTADEIHTMSKKPDADGFSVWEEDENGQRECDVYLMPRDEYQNLTQFHLAYGHEMDHCERGYFHDEEPPAAAE